jgi:ankyrin repeat protein
MKIVKRIAALLIALSVSHTASAASPLADAAENKDRAKLQSLLKNNANANASQVDGMTALHWAAHHDDLDAAKILIKAGAKANPRNRYGVTPLYSACLNGNGKMTELLLDKGADPNATLHEGETTLMTASRTGQPGPVKALLEKGAKVNAKGRKNQSALMWAAADGHVEIVKLLLKAGADSRAQLDSGFTPLFFAVREGRTQVVETLLSTGIDVNEVAKPKSGRLPRGTSPLTLAVENGHFELAAKLLEAGASPNDMRAGYTPLHMLSWVRKPDGGDGADDLAPPEGSGAMSSAQFAKALVKHGANINARLTRGKANYPGATPFMLASMKADVPLMQTLLALGADSMIPNGENSTPLMVATGIGKKMEAASAGTEPEILEASKLLLKLGVDINAVNDSGETAMHGAAYKNLPKVVKYLDENGANIKVWHKRNKRGSTPYLIAAGYRPGNFKPSRETMAAIKEVMAKHGVEPTEAPPTRVDPYAKKTARNNKSKKRTTRQPIKLFNGWNLEGWTIQNKGRFSVEDGVLKIDGGTGWLRSDKTYSDFTLVMEFRFLEPKANSGIFVRTGPTSKKDENGWPDHGYQIQCMDTLTGKPLATMLPYGAPPFEHKSDLEALKKAYKPAGQWHTYEITAKGETLKVKLNGILITTCTSIKNRSGHIGIQGEHGLLEFRKIELSAAGADGADGK